MKRQVIWSRRALKQIDRLDFPIQRRIGDAVDRLAEEGRGDIKRLSGARGEAYRLRVGGWRVIFTYEDGAILLVQMVGSRGDIYKR